MKSQMSLVIDILEDFLEKEDNHAPSVVTTLVISLRLPGVIIDQRRPHAINFPVQDSLLGFNARSLLLRYPCQQPLSIPQPNQRNQVQNQKQAQIKTQVDLERKRPDIDLIPITYSQLIPHLIRIGMVVPRFFPPMPMPNKPWYDENPRCEFHDGSEGHNSENRKDFQKLVHELINDKVLTLKKNDPSMEILITRSDNDDVKGSPKTIEDSSYPMDVKTLKASIEDIGEVISSSQNDLISTIRQLKEELRASSRKEILKSSKGQPPAMLVHCHHSKSSKPP